MSIDPERLAYALQLFGVEPPEGSNATKLAGLLGVEEEILPWLTLRANALAAHEEIDRALREAATRVTGPGTSRVSARISSAAQRDATRELDRALETLIQDNIERQELALTADARLAELVRLSAAGRQEQPQNYILIDNIEN